MKKIISLCPVSAAFIAACLLAFAAVSVAPELKPYIHSYGASELAAHPIHAIFGSFLYAVGHFDAAHISGNLAALVIVGPAVEIKFGSRPLAYAIAINVILTAAMHAFIFDGRTIGASGVVYMLSAMLAILYFWKDAPVMTIILVAAFVGVELIDGMRPNDGIAQSTHILGAALGIFFGFAHHRTRRET